MQRSFVDVIIVRIVRSKVHSAHVIQNGFMANVLIWRLRLLDDFSNGQKIIHLSMLGVYVMGIQIHGRQ